MKIRKRIVAKKALQTFVMYSVAVGGALTQVEIPEGDLTDKALLTLGVGVLAAVFRAVNNVRKTRKAEPRPAAYVNYKNLALFAVLLSLGLSGCITTTAPDGTVTQAVDTVALSTAWDRYERQQARRDGLEAERERAPVVRRVEIDSELVGLDRELRALAERLGVAVP